MSFARMARSRVFPLTLERSADSSVIFENAGSSTTKALLGSFGYGLINWVFSFPAFL